MKENDREANVSRRNFLKTAGAFGVGTLVAPLDRAANAGPSTPMKVPTRPFGKTGVQVSSLAMGGMFDIPSNQLILRQSLKLGITYWDTADCYGGGASEEGIGKWFKKHPETRKDVFLVTKSDDNDAPGMTRLLNRSLERMNTNYVDLYFLHGVKRTSELTDEVRKWAHKAKADKKIRFFGFSTHTNMPELLMAASKLNWIDGIMMTYNYRLMHETDMQAAVNACVKAGIGLTAMKTQGGRSAKIKSSAEKKMVGNFLEKGFTEYQAKLKAVWSNPQIASICSQMPNMTILMANAAASMDKTVLAANDMELLRLCASETKACYCAGCANICESALTANDVVPIGDVMRYLMYYRSYGDYQRARELFRDIPADIRRKISANDYGLAEERCPQKMAIGRLMQEAVVELA